MPDPTPRQAGHPDALLTNVALAYAQQNADIFIAPRVFPQVPVGQSSARYKVFPRSYFLRDEVGPRPLGGFPRQVGYKLSDDSYVAEEEALEAMIDDRERADAVPPHRIEEAKVRLLTEQHLIHRDKQWAATFFKTGVWGTDLTGIATGTPTATQFLRWDNDNSTPIREIFTRSFGVGQKVGGAYRPRTLVLGVDVFIALMNHPGILERMSTSEARMIDQRTLAQFFGVDEVLVPQGVQNVGPIRETVAATDSAADYRWIVGSKDALLVYSSRNPGIDTPSGGYIFAWTGLLGANAYDPTASVTRGRVDRGYSDWFHVRVAYDMKVVAPELGVFFSGAVS